MPSTVQPKNQKDRAEWYDREGTLPEQDATKMSGKTKVVISQGYRDIPMPKPRDDGHAQTKSERSRVGSKWPGPKGRVGTILHGKSSPSSPALKQRKSRESRAK
jgi:hypothetical protein